MATRATKASVARLRSLQRAPATSRRRRLPNLFRARNLNGGTAARQVVPNGRPRRTPSTRANGERVGAFHGKVLRAQRQRYLYYRYNPFAPEARLCGNAVVARSVPALFHRVKVYTQVRNDGGGDRSTHECVRAGRCSAAANEGVVPIPKRYMI